MEASDVNLRSPPHKHSRTDSPTGHGAHLGLPSAGSALAVPLFPPVGPFQGVGAADDFAETQKPEELRIDAIWVSNLLEKQNLLMQMLIEERQKNQRHEGAASAKAESAAPAASAPDVSSAPAAVTAPPGLGQPQKKTIRLSKAVGDKIVSEAAKLKKVLHKMANLKDLMDKQTKQLESLAKGVVPSQCKPFRLPFDAVEWCLEIGQRDLAKLIIPAKSKDTFAQLAERPHIEHLASQTLLSLHVNMIRADSLRVEVTLQSFTACCMASAAKELAALEESSNGLAAFDSSVEAETQAAVHEACEKAFWQQLRSIATEKVRDDESKQKQREKELRAMEKATLLPHDEVVRRGLKELLKPRGKIKKHPYDSEEQVVDFAKFLNLSVGSFMNESVPLKQKNEESPGGGRGHNQERTASRSGEKKQKPGKGSGKGSGQKKAGKGKGKGKEQSKSAPQQKGGKAKGKGKEQLKGKAGGKGKPPAPTYGGQPKGKGGKAKGK